MIQILLKRGKFSILFIVKRLQFVVNHIGSGFTMNGLDKPGSLPGLMLQLRGAAITSGLGFGNTDSPAEGGGFETVVPGVQGNVFFYTASESSIPLPSRKLAGSPQPVFDDR
jgi:hypothetical protein